MNVYTCKKFLPNFLIYIAVATVVRVFFILIDNYNYNPFVSKPEILLSFAIVLIALDAALLVGYTVYYIKDFVTIFMARKTDKLKTVEGEIQNLKLGDYYFGSKDTFTVNGVEFCLNKRSRKPGYNKQAVYGGVFSEEGKSVKISYVERKSKRYIMSIDIFEQKQQDDFVMRSDLYESV